MTHFNRRHLLQAAGGGFGALALRDLLAADSQPLAAKQPQFLATAKSIVFLFMYGGPSHVDLLDEKTELTKQDGKAIPVFRQEDAFNVKTKNVAMKSPYRFRRYGDSGMQIAETYPHLAQHADDMCVIRSMYCESNNHGPALFQMNSGFVQAGRPCMGSWVNYGLGSDSENLPGFVVLMDHQGAPVNGALNWSNGFMPAAFQGVPFRSSGEPIAYLTPPKGPARKPIPPPPPRREIGRAHV